MTHMCLQDITQFPTQCSCMHVTDYSVVLLMRKRCDLLTYMFN